MTDRISETPISIGKYMTWNQLEKLLKKCTTEQKNSKVRCSSWKYNQPDIIPTVLKLGKLNDIYICDGEVLHTRD